MKDNVQSSIMNELKLNDTYFSLKMSYIILNKELSSIKKKNDSLNQQAKELQTIISLTLQRSVTKEEMKEIINEGLSSINAILTIKETQT